MFRSILICTLLMFTASAVSAEMIISYRTAESDKDKRQEYNLGLLRLALEKTAKDYGSYRLVPVAPMNIARSIEALKKNEAQNLVLELSYEDTYDNSPLDFIPFPIDLGAVGYRICFISPELAAKPALPSTLDELRRYSIGQGIGWADVKILRHNGFKVVEVGSYESLFKMVAAGRFDMLCRGINELYKEYDAHSFIPNLHYDNSVSIYYALPRFFFTHKSNTLAKKRLYEGLRRAYQDGSLQKLWQQEYQESVDKADLAHRHLFRLENPLIKTLKLEYQQYLYDPIHRRFPPANP